MGRFGIFVDAGYLYAASGKLCFGISNRNELLLNFKAIAAALADRASHDCQLDHLRTYWYDGARDARPTAQHLDVANLPGVKLRLGRLVRHGQKGVDSRIVRDLIVLSQARATSTAYLLGGDEDLREGVSEAQERGVRVVLMAIEPLNEQNLSPTLAMEADEIVILGKDFIAPHIGLREAVAGGERVLVSTATTEPASLGREFALACTSRMTDEERADLWRGGPRLPAELDRSLMEEAAARIGVRDLDQPTKRALRKGFWEAVIVEREFVQIPEARSDGPSE